MDLSLKYMAVLQEYECDLEYVRKLFQSKKEDPPIPRCMPPVSFMGYENNDMSLDLVVGYLQQYKHPHILYIFSCQCNTIHFLLQVTGKISWAHNLFRKIESPMLILRDKLDIVQVILPNQLPKMQLEAQLFVVFCHDWS